MKAIPTEYAGIEFRSRLEARWAAFFTGINWDWTYEPFDSDGYIPDFLIHGPNPLLVEVKPAVTEDDYRAPWEKINKGLKNEWKGGVFIAGADPLPKSLWDSEFISSLAGRISPMPNLGHCDDCWKVFWSEHNWGDSPSDDLICKVDNCPFRPDCDHNFSDGKRSCEHWRWWWSYAGAEAAYWITIDGQIRLRPEWCTKISTGEKVLSHRGDHPAIMFGGGGDVNKYQGDAVSRVAAAWADACNETKWRG